MDMQQNDILMGLEHGSRYSIGTLIGKGMYGSVYNCEHLNGEGMPGSDLVIKITSANVSKAEIRCLTIIRKIQVRNSLPKLFDFGIIPATMGDKYGTGQNQEFMVMEKFSVSLYDLECNILTKFECLDMCCQLLDQL